jgi:hypothetical protein
VAWGAALALERVVGTRGLAAQAVTALVPVALGVLTYGLAARRLALSEAEALLSLLRRRKAGA